METTGIQKKICLLGDLAVGKTSLVRQFVQHAFEEKYLSSIGVTISQTPVEVADNKMIHLVVWDLAGSEEHHGYRVNYLQGVSGAILVCDLSREGTLHSIVKYHERLLTISPDAQVLIFANKTDLVLPRKIPEHQLERIAEELKAPYLIGSAKTGLNVEIGFHLLTRKLMFK